MEKIVRVPVEKIVTVEVEKIVEKLVEVPVDRLVFKEVSIRACARARFLARSVALSLALSRALSLLHTYTTRARARKCKHTDAYIVLHAQISAQDAD